MQNIPDETWAGATAENVGEILVAGSDLVDPESANLRELLISQQVPPLTDAARALLAELCPEAIPLREEQIREDQYDRELRGRPTP